MEEKLNVNARRAPPWAQKKINWLVNLKPGDVVCDCRYLHIPISTIKFEYVPKTWVRSIYRVLPVILADKIEMFLWNRNVPGFTEIIDAEIEAEDGRCCSAFHCCDDPTDHKVTDHPPLTDAECVLAPEPGTPTSERP